MPTISRKDVEQLLKSCSPSYSLDIFAVERLTTVFGYWREFLTGPWLTHILQTCHSGAVASVVGLEDVNKVLEICSSSDLTTHLAQTLQDWIATQLPKREAEVVFIALAYQACSMNRDTFPVYPIDLERDQCWERHASGSPDLTSTLMGLENRGIIRRNLESEGWELKVLVHRFARTWVDTRRKAHEGSAQRS